MDTVAVITGDIVNSSLIVKEKREHLLYALKTSFNEINREILKEPKSPFEIFRGDSFQVVIKKPELSLLISLLIRAKLRSIIIDKKSESQPVKKSWDARIAIGIGNITFNSKKVIESDGQAFQFSGKLLDAMSNSKTKPRLNIKTPWEDVNTELEVPISFTDAIVSVWSVFQAEAFFLHLLRNETQISLAEQLGRAQPTIRKRMVAGKVESIDLFRKRFEKLISSKI